MVCPHASALEAEIVVVYAIDTPVYAPDPFGYIPMPLPPVPDLDELRERITREWCAPLVDAKVPFRILLTEGRPAAEIIGVAERETADLVVVGRRGRGGFAELLLGSTEPCAFASSRPAPGDRAVTASPAPDVEGSRR